ncbi:MULTISPECIES: XRE family transcriptional regulator [unclassified Lactococcus]|uniref:XRE family transcriptional regulator n=1 Tax=unclassified Lactococcus TaxID=2643510 RepID=UPI0011C711D7|nr:MULTISPECIES: XRE family transcriptional regulator [unclassified Lactococcus]MQW23414.1 helix-turn-helix domain-containing protein [Lactococcus sp. dk101]TXK37074.1 helix-turn-helix transcriptional regulator [Lactococcus sp. dk310]TXK37306.1 helix-turn-helix transcriptional regulator [Lactococcus sp. dk310]TXK47698.1 helix-turn-helix transcriptional regulator [Lactococcus sp. dk322]
MKFSNRLKKLRKELDLSQTELANKIGVSYQAIQKYELEKGKPRAKNIEALANFFNVSISYLLGESNLRQGDKITQIMEELSIPRQEKTINFAENQLNEQTEENKIIQFNASLCPYRVIEQALSAGTGFGYTDDVSYSTVYWHEELKYDLATWINGNSMEPDFHNGEVVLIKKQDQADYEGQVCAVDWDGNSYIKKVYMEEEGLVLRSINPIYDDKFASWDEQPRIIGIVTAHFKPERKK